MGNPDRPRGPQDPRLEIGRNHSTPTSHKDISERARHYKALLGEGAIALMRVQGTRVNGLPQEMVDSADVAWRTIRREAVMAGFNGSAFKQVVRDEVELRKRKEKEREEDMALVRAEFPGQFPETDWEHQAFMGEPPVKRRGW